MKKTKTLGAIAILALMTIWLWPVIGVAMPASDSMQQADEETHTDEVLAAPEDWGVPGDITLHQVDAPSSVEPSYLKEGFFGAGLYAARDYYNLSPNDYPIVGGHRTFYWNELEPVQGQYNWDPIYNFVNAQVALGRQASFGISTYNGIFGGISVPTWFSSAYSYAIVLCGPEQHPIPKYWHDRYKEKYGNFILALGQEFDGNPNVSWIQIGTGMYGENQPCAEYYDSCLIAAGLDMTQWIATSNTITDYYLSAFHETPVLFQFAPIYINAYERLACSDYAANRGAGLMHDGLVPDRVSAYGSDSACTNQAGHWDPIVTYNGLVPIAFETYRLYLPTRADVYWAMLNGLAKHADYINIGKCLLNECDVNEEVIQPLQPITDNFPIFEFTNRYLGKTIDTTPSVWVALRDTEYTYCPDAGNFEFWLAQDDDVAGGDTVPEWNVGSADQGRYTRRTDQATGNSFMYFDVADGYIYGGVNEVEISVTYYDNGLDSWELQYQGQTTNDIYKSAGVVQKFNTGQWLTATFSIDDAEFTNRQVGGNDFRISCLNDGNEYIHKVDLREIVPNQVQIPMDTGWNLVSLPLIPLDPSLTVVLSSIDGSYEIVTSYINGEWKAFIPGKPLPAQNLTELNTQMGIWIKMAGPGTLTITGETPGTTNIALNSGYNDVGFPATSSQDISSALASIAGQYEKVLRFVDGQYQAYKPNLPPVANDFAQLDPGYGYKIKTTEPCTLTINN